jgi:hypothetical protein
VAARTIFTIGYEQAKQCAVEALADIRCLPLSRLPLVRRFG